MDKLGTKNIVKDDKNSNEAAIRVKNVSKNFKIPREKHTSLKSAVINIFNKGGYEIFHALDDVSFEVKKGEFFGIIGRNGSGKSTMLKILAGIYVTDKGKGSIEINGKLSPFLELGVGFNPELTGRENVYLGGAVLGLSKEEVTEKFDRIVAFAELSEFIDLKFKNYSSGMQVRLAFALAINARAEILLMDEVLAVGDVNFQAKCMEEFDNYRREGKTVVLVTHDIGTAQKHCDRLMILEDGHIKMIGKPSEVGDAYLQMIMDKEELREEGSGTEASKSDNKQADLPNITRILFLDQKGEIKKTFHTGDNIFIRVYFDNPSAVKKLNFGVAIFDSFDKYIFGVNTIDDGISTEKAVKRGYCEISYKDFPLRTGTYYIKTALRGSNNSRNYDFVEKSPVFKVYTSDIKEGLVDLEYKWM